MQLEGKYALVTGAGRGMGRAISLQLAEEGANIAVSDIDASTAEDTAVAVKQLGRESIVLPADMGDLQDIDRMFTQAKDAFGRLDVVVNNAGVTKYLDIMDVQEEDWDRIHRVNAKGVFFCMQRAARELIDQGQGGRIINIASIAGLRAHSSTPYTTSKAGVIGLTFSMAADHAADNIRVNAIAPGLVYTPMVAPRMNDDLRQFRTDAAPLKTEGTGWDVGYAALFLASDESRWITGICLPVDAGLTSVHPGTFTPMNQQTRY